MEHRRMLARHPPAMRLSSGASQAWRRGTTEHERRTCGTDRGGDDTALHPATRLQRYTAGIAVWWGLRKAATDRRRRSDLAFIGFGCAQRTTTRASGCQSSQGRRGSSQGSRSHPLAQRLLCRSAVRRSANAFPTHLAVLHQEPGAARMTVALPDAHQNWAWHVLRRSS
jgi:hypothetical protein